VDQRGITAEKQAFVMLALAKHVDEKGRCFPGHQTLAIYSRSSTGTVKRCLQFFKQQGWLRSARRGGTGTGATSNEYVIDVDGLREAAAMTFLRDLDFSLEKW
jgi:hypothetical protein